MLHPAFRPSELAHTFSIVARDPATGHLGVAVQSHWFNVGLLVLWAEPGAGVVATQAMVNPSYGPLGLRRMAAGEAAPDALDALLASDDGRDLRQVAMVDTSGRVAAHTGSRCMAEAGHATGKGYSVQANIMASARVWPEMANAYEQTHGDLPARMLAALDAAQAAGGDLRGKQSAAMLVVDGVSSDEPWNHVLLELRVEDHPEPLVELRRLLTLQRAYDHMNRGDDLLGKGLVEEALAEYRTAAGLAPDIAELPFWHAVTLADVGRVQEALAVFRQAFRADPNLRTLLRRLPAAGMVHVDPETLELYLSA